MAAYGGGGFDSTMEDFGMPGRGPATALLVSPMTPAQRPAPAHGLHRPPAGYQNGVEAKLDPDGGGAAVPKGLALRRLGAAVQAGCAVTCTFLPCAPRQQHSLAAQAAPVGGETTPWTAQVRRRWPRANCARRADCCDSAAKRAAALTCWQPAGPNVSATTPMSADEGPRSGSGEGTDTAVFVGNLQWWTTDVELETLCAEFGAVQSIRFIEDKACGRSRGMAVVEFGDTGAATRCVNGLNG